MKEKCYILLKDSEVKEIRILIIKISLNLRMIKTIMVNINRSNNNRMEVCVEHRYIRVRHSIDINITPAVPNFLTKIKRN